MTRGEPLTPGREKVVDFADLPTACPHSSVDAAARVDPYWGGIWSTPSTASWLSMSTARRRDAMGLARLREPEARWSIDEGTEMMLGKYRKRRLHHLAAINLWRTMTVEQLAAMSGVTTMLPPDSWEVDVLFASGLVQKGTFVTGMKQARLPRLLRPDPNTDFGPVSRRLTYAEWVGVTGGQPWRWGSQFDRHNLLGTELGLRVAEWCDVAAVFGEALGGQDLLTGFDEVALARRAADAVFVRGDGLKIAVEVTAASSVGMISKIEHWARLLARDRTGSLVVLFVESGHPDLPATEGRHLEGVLRKRVAASAHGNVDAALANVADRMFVARWQDWFPAPGKVLRSFTGLPARRAVGGQVDGRRSWVGADLLDPFDVPNPSAGSPDCCSLLAHAGAVMGQPSWLRSSEWPDYSRALVRRAGLEELPVAANVRSDRRRVGRS